MSLTDLSLKRDRMNAVVYGGRSPIALKLCRQLADSGHGVHLITRVRDESIVNLGRENGCTEIHKCDLETLDKSIALANKIDDRVGGFDAVTFCIAIEVHPQT
jgi:NAD(P)-dependent dehydrogenase (short-subunit alcohol dehydrogenase family)